MHALSSEARILCEIHPRQLVEAGRSEDELLEYLEECGRQPRAVDARNPEGIYHAWLDPD